MSMRAENSKFTDYAALLLFCFVIFTIVCKSFLLQSFWLDECVTFWITKDALPDAVNRSIEFQGQSPLYYILVWGMRNIFASSEIALRSLSLVSLIGTCLVLYHLARELFGKDLAFLAVALFLSIDSVLLSLSARPYGLALFFALGSMAFFRKFLIGSSLTQLLISHFCVVLCFYFHYLFLLILVPQLLSLILSRKNYFVFLFSLSGIFLLCLPGFWQLHDLWQRRQSLFFTSDPSFMRLLNDFVPTSHLVYLLGTILLVLIFFCAKGKKIFTKEGGLKRNDFIYFLLWYLIPPLPFFLYAKIFGAGLFTERYFVWQGPAIAILGASILSLIADQKIRRIAVCIALTFICFREFNRSWRLENWKDVVSQVNATLHTDPMPVYLYSGLIENLNEAWLQDTSKSEYLKAPTAAYPVDSQITVKPPVSEKFIFLFLNNKYRPKLPDERYVATPIVNQGLVQAWIYSQRPAFAMKFD